jgi:hypothetical protein
MHMTPDDTYDAPFQTDDTTIDDDTEATENRNESELPDPEDTAEDTADVEAAKQAWSGDAEAVVEDSDENEELAELAQPFIGQWNQLISTTNWEKGRIISEWREALIDSGADSQQYSDEAWARRVGGVTAPHVGRLRRVHDRFASTYQTYEGLYWSHFLAALDWDDAPLWLEGASRESWSVAGMREKRWESHGAVESQRPTTSEIIEVETDEDVVVPAQGGGRTKEYGDESGVASGPRHEDPDFGDEDELMSLSGSNESTSSSMPESGVAEEVSIQPFAGLPELPDDLADAIETLKLAALRHKTSGWQDTDVEAIQKYLDAISVLIRSP